LRLLKKVNEEFKTTIVVITHTMSVVKLICDRVAVMNEGKVVEIGETSKVFEDPHDEVTKNFINTLRTLESGKL
jgi:D-methionine transport system ATP-binding protein